MVMYSNHLLDKACCSSGTSFYAGSDGSIHQHTYACHIPCGPFSLIKKLSMMQRPLAKTQPSQISIVESLFSDLIVSISVPLMVLSEPRRKSMCWSWLIMMSGLCTYLLNLYFDITFVVRIRHDESIYILKIASSANQGCSFTLSIPDSQLLNIHHHLTALTYFK